MPRRLLIRRDRRQISRVARRCLVAGVVAIWAAAVAGVVLTGSGPRASAATNTCGSTGVLSGTGTLLCTYSTVGSDTFTVPAGITHVNVSVIGAAGGNYFIDGDA